MVVSWACKRLSWFSQLDWTAEWLIGKWIKLFPAQRRSLRWHPIAVSTTVCGFGWLHRRCAYRMRSSHRFVSSCHLANSIWNLNEFNSSVRTSCLAGQPKQNFTLARRWYLEAKCLHSLVTVTRLFGSGNCLPDWWLEIAESGQRSFSPSKRLELRRVLP